MIVCPVSGRTVDAEGPFHGATKEEYLPSIATRWGFAGGTSHQRRAAIRTPVTRINAAPERSFGSLAALHRRRYRGYGPADPDGGSPVAPLDALIVTLEEDATATIVPAGVPA